MGCLWLHPRSSSHRSVVTELGSVRLPASCWFGGKKRFQMGDGEEYQLVQSNKMNPTLHDLIKEAVEQASWSHEATAWRGAVLPQERHTAFMSGLLAWGWSHCTRLGRKARSGIKQPRASRMVAGG